MVLNKGITSNITFEKDAEKLNVAFLNAGVNAETLTENSISKLQSWNSNKKLERNLRYFTTRCGRRRCLSTGQFSFVLLGFSWCQFTKSISFL